MIFDCCDQKRRDLVDQNNKAGGPPLNGIDFLEVLDQDAIDPSTGLPFSPRQQTLMVHLLLAPPVDGTGKLTTILASNVLIQGGVRVTGINVVWVDVASDSASTNMTAAEMAFFNNLPNAGQILLVRTDSTGDFSNYTLQLAVSSPNPAPLPGFDPRLSEIQFNFKVECPNPFDCAPPAADCPPTPAPDPEINYLAKDYPSFRTLILDRISQLVPGWNATSPADLGITLAELMAYVGDYLSYQQDSVSTEAYLATARSRVSLRRHALLVDYHVFDGNNARAWVQVQVDPSVSGPVLLSKGGTKFYTRIPGLPPAFAPDTPAAQTAAQSTAQVFEPMIDTNLFSDNNQFNFYTWGDTRCCLPMGATSATLLGNHANLHQGDLLVFQEILDPLTGSPSDADPTHRWAVRLNAEPVQTTDPLVIGGVVNPITEIQWDPADALPFPLCVSASLANENGTPQILSNVSVALGNIVLVDNGLTIQSEDLGVVPASSLVFAHTATGQDRCNPPTAQAVPPRYRPSLAQEPLTQAASLDTVTATVNTTSFTSLDPSVTASGAMTWTAAQVTPFIQLTEVTGDSGWTSQQDLLESGPASRDFVVEIDTDGTAFLRFGDGTNGLNPVMDDHFTATYRVGNGTAGNVGAGSIVHVLTPQAGNVASPTSPTGPVPVTNPLAAQGGLDPESADQIVRRAPQAFRTQQRAVTAADYENQANTVPGVEKTEASFRWTGSWHTVFLTVDPMGGGAPSPALLSNVDNFLEPLRMAGYDLQLNSPLFVSLEIGLFVCVNPGYFRSDVEQALLRVLSNQMFPDGTKGLFFPDNFTFGQTVFLSPIYQAALKVAGVDSVQVTVFQRQGIPTNEFLVKGELELGSLEIARLDNDPNFPENGVLTLEMCGGK